MVTIGLKNVFTIGHGHKSWIFFTIDAQNVTHNVNVSDKLMVVY